MKDKIIEILESEITANKWASVSGIESAAEKIAELFALNLSKEFDSLKSELAACRKVLEDTLSGVGEERLKAEIAQYRQALDVLCAMQDDGQRKWIEKLLEKYDS